MFAIICCTCIVIECCINSMSCLQTDYTVYYVLSLTRAHAGAYFVVVFFVAWSKFVVGSRDVACSRQQQRAHVDARHRTVPDGLATVAVAYSGYSSYRQVPTVVGWNWWASDIVVIDGQGLDDQNIFRYLKIILRQWSKLRQSLNKLSTVLILEKLQDKLMMNLKKIIRSHCCYLKIIILKHKHKQIAHFVHKTWLKAASNTM